MPLLTFKHPRIESTLTIETGANDITWGYGLNTQTIPTYGGEVIQVLSAYIDDLEASGEVKTYAKMEEIYRWFIEYMQLASQGRDGNRYIEEPITFEYPHRGWSLKIQVKDLPGFKYGVDVVAPQWQIKAQIIESDEELNELALQAAIDNDFQFGRISSGIGYKEENPFSDPKYFYKITKDNRTGGDIDEYDPKAGSKILLDYIDKFAQIMVDGDALINFFETGSYGADGASSPAQGQNKQADRKEQSDINK